LIDAGRLKTPITIEQRVAGISSWGDPSEDWETFCQTRADIRWPSGMSTAGESITADRETSRVACSMRVRYRTGITSAMRVKTTIDGVEHLFEIKSVAPDIGAKEYVDLVCTFGDSDC
jgi:SPP1 family predicted phage head-tail adaptor